MSQLSSVPPARRAFGHLQALTLGWVALVCVYFFWGSTYLAIRLGDRTWPPFLLAASRYLIAGVVLYPLASGSASRRDHRDWRNWRSAAIIGILMLLGGNGLLTVGEVTLPAGVAALLVATVPMWLVVLDAVFVSHRSPTITVWLGLGLGVTGILILAQPTGVQRVDLVAAIGVLLGTILWAAGSLYSRRSPHPTNPFLTSAQQMLIGGLACLAIGFASGEMRSAHI